MPAVADNGPGRRWALVAVAMVLSFALGAFVFGGGGDDESAEVVTAAETSTPEVASAGPVPPTVPETVPPTAVPTTIVETTVPPTVPETVPPTEPPALLSVPSRNDLQIDDLEWLAITDLLVQEFTMEVPSKDVASAVGLQACEAARTSATAADWEVALTPILVSSGLPAGQTAMLIGGTTAMMCMDELIRLIPDEMPTF